MASPVAAQQVGSGAGNGVGPQVPPGGGSPAGSPAGSILTDDIEGVCIIGTLVFGGTTERRPKMVSVDVQCRDGDGRLVIEQADGWLSQQDNSLTPLGRLVTTGELARLVGSKVAVAIRLSAKDGRVFRSVEGVFPLSRVSQTA